ncbi:Serine/threonine-protein phosphatase 7 long form [Glycine soja]
MSVVSNLFSWKCSMMCSVIEWHQPDRVLRQFGMQQPIPRCHSQPFNIHSITLKGKHDENWGQLLGPMINQWNNRVDFRVDGYPRQKGLLSFNSDYMVWYRQKMKMFVDSKNENTTILRITEPLSHGPPTEHEFPTQEFNILQSSVETHSIARRREAVEAEPYLYL